MFFLIELANIVKKISDSKFSLFTEHRDLFFEQYPQFEKQWDEYCVKNRTPNKEQYKKWRNMLREMRHWKMQELDHMYMQIMSLARNFLGRKYHYFEVKSYSGNTTIPDKAVILNRLMVLYSELLNEIYPSIIRLLSYSIKDIEIETSNPRGTILFQKTITNAIKNSGGIPITFSCSIPDRTFDTPENRLLLMAIKSIHNDALQVYQYQKRASTDTEDKRKVWEIINVTDSILDSTPLHEIKMKTTELHLLRIPKDRLKKRLYDVENDLEKRRVRQTEYYKLIQWTRKYIDFNANRYDDALNFTLENTEDIDTMFELWGLFQFVNYIKLNFPGVKIEPFGKMSKSKKRLKLKGFEIEYSGQKFKIAYENNLRAQIAYHLESVNLTPDYSIEYSDNDKPIILDAKNYLASNRQEAVQKMEHYLINFYRDYKSKTGILFFPEYEERDDKNVPKTWDQPLEIREDIKFRLITYVIKATRDPQYKQQLDGVFAEICGLIRVLS